MSEEEKKCGRIPLCGIVKSHTQDGDIEVQWLMGRTRNEDGKDTFVFWSSRLQPDLSSIPIGSWFYGACDLADYSGKYELVWVEKPSVCSETNNRAENELDRIPLWGKVVGHNTLGGIRVKWLMGRNEEEEGKETVVGQCSRLWIDLHSIPVGSWFYGVAKPGNQLMMEWIEKPFVCPEPYDLAARTKLWDSLTVEKANEPGCIPLKADVVNVNNPCKEITVGLMFDRSQESEQEKQKQAHLRNIYRKYDDRLQSLYFDMSEEMPGILPEPFLQAVNSHRVLTSKEARGKRVELLKEEKDGTLSRKEYLVRNNEINTEMNLKSIEFLLSFLRCVAYGQ